MKESGRMGSDLAKVCSSTEMALFMKVLGSVE
jgi:hypothetical protein